jgi:hypothetical protein
MITRSAGENIDGSMSYAVFRKELSRLRNNFEQLLTAM